MKKRLIALLLILLLLAASLTTGVYGEPDSEQDPAETLLPVEESVPSEEPAPTEAPVPAEPPAPVETSAPAEETIPVPETEVPVPALETEPIPETEPAPAPIETEAPVVTSPIPSDTQPEEPPVVPVTTVPVEPDEPLETEPPIPTEEPEQPGIEDAESRTLTVYRADNPTHQSFLYEIVCPDGSRIQVVLPAEQSHFVIAVSLEGTYTVREKTDWNWRAEGDGDITKTAVVGPDSTDPIITFSSQRGSGRSDSQRWLSGTDSVEIVVNGG